MKSGEPYSRLKKRIDSYISKYPLPSREVNTQRFQRLRELESDPDHQNEYTKLRDEIILSNGGFGMRYAIKYCRIINDSSVIEDVFQQAQIGLIESVDLFDPDVGVNFTTFAYWYVIKCIIEFIKENKVVKVPRSMARNIKNVKDVSDVLYSENGGRQPLGQEVQKRLKKTKDIDISVDVINDIMRLIELNSAATDETFLIGSIEDLSGDDTKNESIVLMKTMILSEFADLNDDLVDIIKMRFGIDYERPFSIPEIRLMKNINDDVIEDYKEDTRIFLNARE